MHPKVVIFGSATVSTDSTEYKQAEQLGMSLASAGYGIVNGGYSGTMEASSKGAYEANGSYIEGIVVPDLFVNRPRLGNSYLTQPTITANLMNRLGALIDASNVYIVLPGSVGTLGEFVLVWNHINVDFRIDQASKKHLICWKCPWKRVVDSLVKDLDLTDRDIKQIHFVEDVDAAMSLVKDLLPIDCDK